MQGKERASWLELRIGDVAADIGARCGHKAKVIPRRNGLEDNPHPITRRCPRLGRKIDRPIDDRGSRPAIGAGAILPRLGAGPIADQHVVRDVDCGLVQVRHDHRRGG